VKRLRRTLTRSDLERMNLPRECWEAKVQFVSESVSDVVRRYLINVDDMVERGAGLFITGGPGVGKSSIASLACKESRARGYTAYFTPVWELRECVKARVLFEETTSVLDRCKQVHVLVLDDLSLDDAKDYSFGARRIEELLSFRGSQRLVSIVTTRLSQKELRQSFGSLLSSTQGCMVFLPVIGPDRRQEQNEELSRAVFGSNRPAS
jgi:DNA replication protein DnaC